MERPLLGDGGESVKTTGELLQSAMLDAVPHHDPTTAQTLHTRSQAVAQIALVQEITRQGDALEKLVDHWTADKVSAPSDLRVILERIASGEWRLHNSGHVTPEQWAAMELQKFDEAHS